MLEGSIFTKSSSGRSFIFFTLQTLYSVTVSTSVHTHTLANLWFLCLFKRSIMFLVFQICLLVLKPHQELLEAWHPVCSDNSSFDISVSDSAVSSIIRKQQICWKFLYEYLFTKTPTLFVAASSFLNYLILEITPAFNIFKRLL